jgi:hypothetical protein
MCGAIALDFICFRKKNKIKNKTLFLETKLYMMQCNNFDVFNTPKSLQYIQAI